MNYYKDLGLKKENLYEILATTFKTDDKSSEIIPNTACMGIRFIDDDLITISPYPDTKTYKNLKTNKFLTINFVSDVSLYALAALKAPASGFKEFPKDLYGYEVNPNNNVKLPIIKEAYASIVGEVVEENIKTKNDELGEVKLTEFIVKVSMRFNLTYNKNPNKYFNRAENLALETIILATRLKVAKQKKNQPLFDSISNQIANYFEIIRRFGRNKSALKALEIVDSYIKWL